MEILQRNRLLPPTVRAAYGFRYGENEGLAAQAHDRFDRSRRIYPLLLARLRYVGPYQEAQQRLRGQAHPSAVTRALNLLWIEKPQL